MFGRIVKAQLKMAVRSKKYMFWTFSFPILLGTLFYFAFSSIYASNKSEPIPVVIEVNDEAGRPFVDVAEKLEYEDGTKMLDIKTASSHEDAEKLLADGDLSGIISIDGLSDIKLLVNGNGVKHSILSHIISEYKLRVDKMMTSGEAVQAEDIDFVEAKGMAGDNKDPFITYFYNLIAMVCVMGSIASLNTIVSNQANQSTTGMRIDSSPAPKVVCELAQLVAVTIMQTLIITVTLFYLTFILKLDFGGDFKMVYLTTIMATIVGVTLGFLVAHAGKMATDKKETLLMVIILGGGFLSGLMMGDMKIIIEEKAPWFNRINPSAVITDAFYSLNVFGVGPRYYRSLTYMIVLSLVMLLVGCVLSKKSSYKSL